MRQESVNEMYKVGVANSVPTLTTSLIYEILVGVSYLVGNQKKGPEKLIYSRQQLLVFLFRRS